MEQLTNHLQGQGVTSFIVWSQEGSGRGAEGTGGKGKGRPAEKQHTFPSHRRLLPLPFSWALWSPLLLPRSCKPESCSLTGLPWCPTCLPLWLWFAWPLGDSFPGELLNYTTSTWLPLVPPLLYTLLRTVPSWTVPAFWDWPNWSWWMQGHSWDNQIILMSSCFSANMHLKGDQMLQGDWHLNLP